jgi:hypothetical protein
MGSFMTISSPQESSNPLKTKNSEKRRNRRQKSSFVVRTAPNALI